MNNKTTTQLQQQDHQYLWHPFTPMKQWREQPPLVIERGEGVFLCDTDGNRYIDGVSSLWCNVHGHNVPSINQAVEQQLKRIAHTTLLGLTSPPAIQFAKQLTEIFEQHGLSNLKKIFYTDAGATAVEVAFKMAVGYWFHNGQPRKNKFIGLAGAYHGDTTGTMSVGYSDLFHKPFISMVFDVQTFPSPDPLRTPEPRKRLRGFSHTCHPCTHDNCQFKTQHRWPSECPQLQQALLDHCLTHLENKLQQQADQTAAVVIEPVMQGAAGMICQPPGFVRRVRELCDQYNVLLIADEVAVGFGRTGKLFACEHDEVQPDILCLAKGITGGYLPLAVTATTDAIEQAFAGELHEKKTLYHGHTYTGNPLACAAAIASLNLFNKPTPHPHTPHAESEQLPGGEGSGTNNQHPTSNLLTHINQSAQLITNLLNPLRNNPNILDIRQRGLMVGIELGQRNPDGSAAPFDFSKRNAYAICDHLRTQGIIIRPLGDVLVLMPIPATPHDTLTQLITQTVETLNTWSF